jgi:hypothetical protein
MDFAGKTDFYGYFRLSDFNVRLLAIILQLALYGYIIIIRLLQAMVGNEISS